MEAEIKEAKEVEKKVEIQYTVCFLIVTLVNL